LLLDRNRLGRSCLLGGGLLGGGCLRLLGHPGWFGLAWSCGTGCAAATDCSRLDVEVVALLERGEALLNCVCFGVFLGCDLADVDLRGVGDGCGRGERERDGVEVDLLQRCS
jgi:hypothetical protein